ncbi:hypothetical protein [Cupriavidus basilensis]|uniref:hypothetical protein n=1 Tax=Cupriavidus basilensis TaxID=68895 RepID=UPI00157A57D8|nr:hypothetical protein [Cupriavidus basilensis]
MSLTTWSERFTRLVPEIWGLGSLDIAYSLFMIIIIMIMIGWVILPIRVFPVRGGSAYNARADVAGKALPAGLLLPLQWAGYAPCHPGWLPGDASPKSQSNLSLADWSFLPWFAPSFDVTGTRMLRLAHGSITASGRALEATAVFHRLRHSWFASYIFF